MQKEVSNNQHNVASMPTKHHSSLATTALASHSLLCATNFILNFPSIARSPNERRFQSRTSTLDKRIGRAAGCQFSTWTLSFQTITPLVSRFEEYLFCLGKEGPQRRLQHTSQQKREF